jgi:hypothetical protein
LYYAASGEKGARDAIGGISTHRIGANGALRAGPL